MLVDRRGVPLSSFISEANRHDMKSAFPTIDGIVVDRPKSIRQNICMDKGYDFPEIEKGVQRRGYSDHIRRKGEEIKKKAHRAKRWVVERTASWHNRFNQKRYGAKGLLAKGYPSVLVSTFLPHVKIEDKLGLMKPALFMTHIGKSGLGNKTPMKKRLEDLVEVYEQRKQQEILAPSRSFSTQGFTDWVTGVDWAIVKKKDKKKGNAEPDIEGNVPPEFNIRPHYQNLILSDEFSTFLGESRGYQHMATHLEFLSELWDGRIQASSTRTHGVVRSQKVYVTLYTAASYRFLQLMQSDMWLQGFGNRVLWIVGEPDSVDVQGLDFFFGDNKDDEWDSLVEDTINKLTILKEYEHALISFGDSGRHNAANLWANYKNKINKLIKESADTDFRTSYYAKMAENALRLSVVYVASRMCLMPNKTIYVMTEDMERAIADMEEYMNMFHKLINLWGEIRAKPIEEPPKSSKYDMVNLLKIAQNHFKGLVSMTRLLAYAQTSDYRKGSAVLANAQELGYLEDVKFEELDLDEQKHVHTKGPKPMTVYRLTDEGRKFIEDKA